MSKPLTFACRTAVLFAVMLLAVVCSSPEQEQTPDASTPNVITKSVGAAGGTIQAEGLELQIPAGALAEETTISVAASDKEIPGYTLASPVFHFSPDGLTFAVPITVTFDFEGAGPVAVFWTAAGSSTTYENLGGTLSGNAISAQVSHFSSGFAGTAGSGTDGGGTPAGYPCEKPGSFVATCSGDNGSGPYCVEYQLASQAELDNQKNNCNGTWSAGSFCPAEGWCGGCLEDYFANTQNQEGCHVTWLTNNCQDPMIPCGKWIDPPSSQPDAGTGEPDASTPVNGERIATFSGGVAKVGADSTHVYYMSHGIERVPLAGGASETVFSGLTGSVSPDGVTMVDAQNCYWSEYGGSQSEGPRLILRAVPKGGGTATTFLDPAPEAAASDGAFVYWIDGTTFDLRKQPVVGGAPSTVANLGSAAVPRYLALDEGFLYFLEFGATDNPGVHKIAVDGTGEATVFSNWGTTIGIYGLTAHGGRVAMIRSTSTQYFVDVLAPDVAANRSCSLGQTSQMIDQVALDDSKVWWVVLDRDSSSAVTPSLWKATWTVTADGLVCGAPEAVLSNKLGIKIQVQGDYLVAWVADDFTESSIYRFDR